MRRKPNRVPHRTLYTVSLIVPPELTAQGMRKELQTCLSAISMFRAPKVILVRKQGWLRRLWPF